MDKNLEFIRRGKTGCVFATILARDTKKTNWERSLKSKVDSVDKILLLGNVSKAYFAGKEIKNKEIYTLIHPSTRNIGIYNQNKESILEVLKKIVKHYNHCQTF